MDECFKKIGVIGKYQDSRVQDEMRKLCQYLTKKQREVFIESDTAENISIRDYEVLDLVELGERVDLCIVVGGDGTLLHAARGLSNFDIPLLGYNLGRLGFLTDISADEMQEQLDKILIGEYFEESRGLLNTCIYRRTELIDQSCAFNDVVVHKRNGARMLEYETFIDGLFINSSRSDGLIVSTPTGSTGYALSGGGPILHPTLHAIVLVPICPHTMTFRPIVVHADSKVEIIVKDCNQSEAQVTCDGQVNLGLHREDKIVIHKHKHFIRLIHPNSYDYYEKLRAKLHWGKRLGASSLSNDF